MATAAEFLDQQDADEFLDAEDDAPGASACRTGRSSPLSPQWRHPA